MATAGEKILSISIAAVDENILVTITDNGIGTNRSFSFDQISGDYSKNIGLKNSHSRIALRFGSPYGLQFSSVPGEGTTVNLLFPKLESRKEIM